MNIRIRGTRAAGAVLGTITALAFGGTAALGGVFLHQETKSASAESSDTSSGTASTGSTGSTDSGSTGSTDSGSVGSSDGTTQGVTPAQGGDVQGRSSGS